MAESNDLTDLIVEQASKPKEVETPLGKVKSRDLSDVIAADQYLKAQGETTNSKRSGWAACRPARFVPPAPH